MALPRHRVSEGRHGDELPNMPMAEPALAATDVAGILDLSPSCQHSGARIH